MRARKQGVYIHYIYIYILHIRTYCIHSFFNTITYRETKKEIIIACQQVRYLLVIWLIQTYTDKTIMYRTTTRNVEEKNNSFKYIYVSEDLKIDV